MTRAIIAATLAVTMIIGAAIWLARSPQSSSEQPVATQTPTPATRPTRHATSAADRPQATNPEASRSPSPQPSQPSSSVPPARPQDRGFPTPADATETPPPAADDITDAQLAEILAAKVDNKSRPIPRLEQSAIDAAWRIHGEDIESARLWTDIRFRAAIAICAGANPDRADPQAVTVILLWSGRRAGTYEINELQISLQHSHRAWTPV